MSSPDTPAFRMSSAAAASPPNPPPTMCALMGPPPGSTTARLRVEILCAYSSLVSQKQMSQLMGTPQCKTKGVPRVTDPGFQWKLSNPSPRHELSLGKMNRNLP